MTTTPYAELFEQGQQAVRTAVDTWTETVTTAVGKLPSFPAQIDAEAAIDRYFELSEKLLGAQRDFAKQVAGYANAAAAPVAKAAKAAAAKA